MLRRESHGPFPPYLLTSMSFLGEGSQQGGRGPFARIILIWRLGIGRGPRGWWVEWRGPWSEWIGEGPVRGRSRNVRVLFGRTPEAR